LFEDRQRRMWRRLVLWSLLLLFTLAFVSLTVNPVSALPLVVLLIMPLAALLSHWHEKLQEQPDAWQRYPLYLTYLLLLLTAIQAWIR